MLVSAGPIRIYTISMFVVSLKYRQYKYGSVLVLVLIVLSSMLILSVGLAYRTQIELRLAQSNARRTQVYYLALGGIERAKTLLSQEELSVSSIARLCQFTASAADEGLFEQVEDFSMSYCLRDEKGYLNLNNSDPSSWANLGFISEQCRASIIDWVDEDDQMEQDGAEADFYQRLEPAYTSKNRPFAALKELLYLRGITKPLYMGEDLNRNLLLDDNERDGRFRLPPDNEDGVLDLGLLDVFTVYGDGRININTTSGLILSALQGFDEQAAEAILVYRAGPDGRFGTEDDAAVENAEDFAEIEGLTELQIELLKDYCCFDSVFFRIFSSAGRDNDYQCSLMATIGYVDNQIRVLSLERLL